jgi:hypothetical protein
MFIKKDIILENLENEVFLIDIYNALDLVPKNAVKLICFCKGKTITEVMKSLLIEALEDTIIDLNKNLGNTNEV